MTRSDRAGGPGLLLLSLLGSAVPNVAHADEGDDAAARALFAEGRKLASSGDYAAACARFKDSYRLDPGMGTSFNLADCEEHLGRTASAWLRFLDVATATKAAGQPERERVARARAAALEPRLSRLVINVLSRAPGMIVRRDGEVISQRLWGVGVPIDPGDHALEAIAAGRRIWTTTIAIPPAPGSTSIDVPALEMEAAPRTVPIASKAPAAKDDGRSVPRLTLGLAVFGVASLATGTVFAVLMEHDDSRAKGLCTGGAEHNLCSSTMEKTQHDRFLQAAERERAIYFVGASVGAASMIAAAAWWWRSSHVSRPESKRELAITVAPRLSANGAQAGLEVTW
jgi:hypothetical protein